MECFEILQKPSSGKLRSVSKNQPRVDSQLLRAISICSLLLDQHDVSAGKSKLYVFAAFSVSVWSIGLC